MKLIKNRKILTASLFALALMLASALAYAEHTAPVYDVDGMSSDNQTAMQTDENAKSALTQALATSSDPPATIEEKVEHLEQQLANMQQSDFSNRLNGMQGEVQALRGQMEELTHQLQELRSQQRGGQHIEADQAADKDLAGQQAMSPIPREGDEEGGNLPAVSRVKSAAKFTVATVEKPIANPLERRAATIKLATSEHAAKKIKNLSTVEQPNVAEEQAVYQIAYNLIKVKKYNEAIGALQKMLSKYPSGQFAANAHYWLGELYSLTGENERAATEFTVVVKQYPSNPRVADAELKLGLVNATLLKWPAAKSSFMKVINQYPGTTSARLAMEQLKLLKQSGH